MPHFNEEQFKLRHYRNVCRCKMRMSSLCKVRMAGFIGGRWKRSASSLTSNSVPTNFAVSSLYRPPYCGDIANSAVASCVRRLD
jgi:hypothetical protein